MYAGYSSLFRLLNRFLLSCDFWQISDYFEIDYIEISRLMLAIKYYNIIILVVMSFGV